MLEDRKWVVALAVGALVCSVIFCAAESIVARLEFTYAAWTHHPVLLPPIVAAFRQVYLFIWIMPIATGVIGVLAFMGRLSKLAVACWISVLAIAHLVWLLFWLLVLMPLKLLTLKEL